MFDWLTSLFSSSAAPAAASTAGSLASNAVGQGALSGLGTNLTGQFVTPALDLGTTTLPETALGNGVTSFMDMAPNTMTSSSGVLGQLGDLLKSPQFKNVASAGSNIFSAINQSKANKKMGNIMDANLAMSRDQYARDKQADEKRQALVF